MATAKIIKTHVSPTVNEANITSLPGYSDATKGYVSDIQSTMKAAYTAVDSVITARKTVNADPSRTPKAKVLAVADVADKYDKQLQKMFENVWDSANKRIAHKQAELTKPIEEYAGAGTVAGEIRNHLKSLDRGERMSFLSSALERGDEKTLKSVLGAPSYLSGLSDVEHSHYVKLYHEKAHPEISAQINLMTAALEKLKQAHKVIRKEFEEAVGANHYEVTKLRAANSAAEEALVIKNLLGLEE